MKIKKSSIMTIVENTLMETSQPTIKKMPGGDVVKVWRNENGDRHREDGPSSINDLGSLGTNKTWHIDGKKIADVAFHNDGTHTMKKYDKELWDKYNFSIDQE